MHTCEITQNLLENFLKKFSLILIESTGRDNQNQKQKQSC